MQYAVRRALTVLTVSVLALMLFGAAALAGTTGSISGKVTDSLSGAPISGAKVTVVAASATESTTTSPSGAYTFVSLPPDTYTMTVEHDGYDITRQPGITVLADQNQSIPVALVKTVATLGRIVVRGTTDLVKPGTTSDVYSINATAQAAATALGGTGNLNSAYAAMLSAPGVNIPQAQQGWYQTVYIRGGDQDQVGWEFDGIPVNRSYDNAPMTMLSNLGQQELQVYTGGTPATSDASSISGYVNQVVKKGSFPGFADLKLDIGFPTFYNKASLEVGGGTPDRRFTYYAGTTFDDTGYRYIDQNNGASARGYFYPLDVFGSSSLFYDGGGSALAAFSPGQSYAPALTRDRESIANLHWSLPHGDQQDDIQLLALASELWMYYNSSVGDLGGEPYVAAANFVQFIPQSDGQVYSGTVFAPVNPAAITPYQFPGSGAHFFSTSGAPCFGTVNGGGVSCSDAVPLYTRDANDNGAYIYKLQYQHNISNRSYFRIFGYSVYSNWFINGPVSTFVPFGSEIADYENIFHQHGVTAQYANQINDQHLVTLSALWNHGHAERNTTTGGFPYCTLDCNGGGGQLSYITNLVDSSGNCYDSSGFIDSCFTRADRGRFPGLGSGPTPYAIINAAARAGARWIVTSNGYHANLNKVDPTFSAAAINDTWKPSDRWTFNIGLRVENYKVAFPDLSVGFPARAFWFAAYNREWCFGPGIINAVLKFNPLDSCAADWAGTSAVPTLTNPGAGSFSHTEYQPRLGFTAQAGPDDVIRGSAGIYSRPASTREASWGTVEQDLPFLLGADFLQYGFTTPEHDVRPDRSTNFDLSWEHHFPGTDLSFKVTPFYRSTQDQLQQNIVNALTGLFANFNAGHQISHGVELAFNKGDFSSDGWSGKLAFTYTRSRLQYGNFANGRNVIDNLNAYIQWYNTYTSACAGSSSRQCSPNGLSDGGNANATACFFPSPDGATPGAPDPACNPGSIANPYFGSAPQPLFDRNGWYTTYDLVPVPFAAANGFETPDVGSLIINYRRNKWSFTPSVVYSSGAKYGSPLSWPGYDPRECTATTNPGVNNTADTTTCTNATGSTSQPNPNFTNPLDPFFMIPDAYTGKFDNLGAFKQPSRITVNMQIGFDATPRVTYTLIVANIVDKCSQRGYPWEYQHICVYSSLPSSILPPVGNFTDPSSLSGQAVNLKFPYAVWLNNNNTGFVGTENPIQAAFEVHVKL